MFLEFPLAKNEENEHNIGHMDNIAHKFPLTSSQIQPTLQLT